MIRRSLQRLLRQATTKDVWPLHERQLREEIKKAEFVAIDLELTGLHARHTKFLGVERCYEAHRDGARSFMPIQLGLCTARRDEKDASKWLLTPATVYVFPQQGRVFHASSSTLQFLRDNFVDFNKWISDGVPYTRLQDEAEETQEILRQIEDTKRLRDRLVATAGGELSSSETSASEASLEVIPSQAPPVYVEMASAEDKLLVDSIREAIKHWLDEKSQCSPISAEEAGVIPNDNLSKESFASSLSASPLEFEVPGPLQRLLLHSLVATEFPSLRSSSVKRGERRFFVVYASELAEVEAQLESLARSLSAVGEDSGATRLIKALLQSKKVLIGHCCFFDFLHLFNSFVGDLPTSLGAFQEQWTERFPSVLDTKLLAESHELLQFPSCAPQTLREICAFMGGHWCCMKEVDAPRFEIRGLSGTNWRSGQDIICLRLLSRPPSALARLSEVKELEGLSEDLRKDGAQIREGVSDEQQGVDLCHDAGFDSLMTVCLFVLQLHEVARRNGNGSALLLVRTTPPSLLLTPPSKINSGFPEASARTGEALVLRLEEPKTKAEVVKMWAPVWVDVHSIDEGEGAANEASVYQRNLNAPSKTWILFVRTASDAQVLREMNQFLYSGKSQ